MMEATDVRFREVRTIRTYSAEEGRFRRGDHALYETQRGVGYGAVILGNYAFCSCKEGNSPQAILGRATKEDAVWAAAYESEEREVLLFCQRRAEALRLDMKIVSVAFSLRDDKVLFFFSMDTRADFRTLVKELGVQYQRRIELHRVDVKDEIRLLGGTGNCGRPFCCHAYLLEFMPVPIKMAEEQGLVLNPQKISGACGRLTYCLRHGTDTYTGFNKTLPRKGDSVQLLDGVHGDAVEVGVLKQMLRVTCYMDRKKELRDVAVTETTIIEHRREGMSSAQKCTANAQCEKKTGKAAVEQHEGKERPEGRNDAPQQGQTREKKK